MIDPYADPGVPDSRGPVRYLWWVLRCQRGRAAFGSTIGILWMVSLMAPPYIMARAVDDGLEPGDFGVLLEWTGVLLAVGLLTAVLAILRHRTMSLMRMDATYRTLKVVTRHTAALGAGLARRISAGEVVTVGARDAAVVAMVMTISGPGVGAVVAYILVAAVLLSISLLLAAVVLVGVPVLVLAVGPLLNRLRAATGDYRERQGALTARISDIVGGLRVLNGIGGKDLLARRYRGDSQSLRAEGYRVSGVASWIQALAVGLPALFVALVVWLSARMAANGSITVGDLVAVYGYAAVLTTPVAQFIDDGYALSAGLVSAQRVVRLLNAQPADDRPASADSPTGPSRLFDPDSAVAVNPGLFTAIAGPNSGEAAGILDRLGRYGDTSVLWGEHPLADIELSEVRQRILVADNEAAIFAGSLREVLDPWHKADDATINRAVFAAAADDIVQQLGVGLDAHIGHRGGNLSSGQRQRLRLARALIADPEILLLVEPTSAVDAHTEARIAQRLRDFRAGRTTVVTTTSPLILEEADVVCYVAAGHLKACGPHLQLMDTVPSYRSLVTRAEVGEDPAPAQREGTG
jgi:ABC-type multidrug transport system fused ATPase/permease subunit